MDIRFRQNDQAEESSLLTFQWSFPPQEVGGQTAIRYVRLTRLILFAPLPFHFTRLASATGCLLNGYRSLVTSSVGVSLFSGDVSVQSVKVTIDNLLFSRIEISVSFHVVDIVENII